MALMNSLKTTNYAGRTVWSTLGFIWLGWAVLMAFMDWWGLALATSAVFALGLLDDLFGSGESKGFKGHLKALSKGKLTTGGIKLFGISLVSFLYAWVASPALIHEIENQSLLLSGGIPFAHGSSVWWAVISGGIALVTGAAIALTSNFFNLLDLRPGRAAKVYLVTIGLTVLGMLFVPQRSVSLVTAVILFALPIATVIIPDLRERGMLGDAGANTAGFVAGALIVSLLPLWALVIYFLVMLALNLASERVSYSQIIDNNPLLKKLDNIGRLKNGE